MSASEARVRQGAPRSGRPGGPLGTAGALRECAARCAQAARRPPPASDARLRAALACATFIVLAGCSALPAATPIADAAAQLRATEAAFAKSMADRDLDAFAAHVAEDAVFINGGKPLRGKTEILASWKRFFRGPTAPFSWNPELVEVTALGDLGYTEGPVFTAQGKITARFYSTWRRSSSGRWHIVFDNGYDVCECAR